MRRDETGEMDSIPANMVVVDGSRIAREALCQLLRSFGFAIVGTGSHASEALQGASDESGPPRLLILSLPPHADANAVLPLIEAARWQVPGLKIVILSDSLQLRAIGIVMRAGADAVLSKNISSEVLRRSLELVLLGQRIFPVQALTLASEEAEAGRSGGRSAAAARRSDPRLAAGRRQNLLSKREHEILRCLTNGMSNKLIARTLDIAEATVKVHIKGVLRKTHLSNRTQVAIWALNNSIWGDPPPAAEALDGAPAEAADMLRR